MQIRLLSRKFIKFSASLSCIQIGSMIAIILTVINLLFLTLSFFLAYTILPLDNIEKLEQQQ